MELFKTLEWPRKKNLVVLVVILTTAFIWIRGIYTAGWETRVTGSIQGNKEQKKAMHFTSKSVAVLTL